MKKLYLKVIETLIENPEVRDLYTDKGISPVKHIDLYSGQDVNPEYFELAVYPAVYIHFAVDHLQNEATITFRLCYEQLRDTSSQSATTEEALKFFDFVELTDRLLSGMESEDFGKLQAVSTEQQTEETVTDQFVLVYRASLIGQTKDENRFGQYEDVKVKGELLQRML